MYMKKISLILFYVAVFCQTNAQQPIMCMPPNNFPVDASGIGTVTNVPGVFSNPNYGASNGAYDLSGNLLFYVKDDGLVGSGIYDATGAFLSDLTSTSEVVSGTTYDAYYLPVFNKEIAIVPVPDACHKYYVIHHISTSSSSSLVKSYLVYEMVDCNTSPPTVYMSSAPLASNPYVIADYNEWQPNCGIAVRKKNYKGKHYLYTTVDGLYRYEITPTGITNEIKLVSIAGSLNSLAYFSTTELEVSPDGKYIAWGVYDVQGNHTNKVIKFSLTSPTFPADQGGLSSSTPTIIPLLPATISTTICGLEFTLDNHLFISASIPGSNQGIFKNLHGTSTASYISSTSNYYSFLERRLDNHIYMVDYTNGQLAKMNPYSNAITTIPLATITAKSNFVALLNPYFYSLPDQIDGEDYTNLFKPADLIIKDEPLDMGIEPTASGLNIWEGEIWNCRTNTSCLTNENPFSYATHHMRARVTNVGCYTSQAADLHMYWTRGRSGEIWDEHWLHPSIKPSNVINGHPAGSEITVTGVATPAPINIPPIASGSSMIFNQPWVVPNGNWYPLLGTDNGVNPMICFLGRIVSANDPMANEQLNTPIGTNVANNNNIATRNSFIITISFRDRLILDGSFMINNSFYERANIDGIRISGLDLVDDPSDIISLDIVLEDRLYNRWVANGRRGVGISDLGDNKIRILDYRIAEISNLQIVPGEAFTIAPLITLTSTRDIRENTRLHSFMINHFYADRTTRSAGVYHVMYTNEEIHDEEDGSTRDEEGSSRKMSKSHDNTNAYVSNEVLHIALGNQWQGPIDVMLYDINGKLIKQLSHETDSARNIEISTDGLAKGMYMLHILSKSHSKLYKTTIY